MTADRPGGAGAATGVILSPEMAEKVSNVGLVDSRRSPRVQRLVLTDFPDPKIARALSPNGRVHWATRKRAREVVECVVGTAIFEQRLSDELLGHRVRITYRWVMPDRRRRDLDNHSTGVVKCVQDCLVRLGVIDADDTSCVTAISTEVVYEKGQRRLEVTITPSGGEE